MNVERFIYQRFDADTDRPSFRVTDTRTDSRIATCYDPINADFICRALNMMVGESLADESNPFLRLTVVLPIGRAQENVLASAVIAAEVLRRGFADKESLREMRLVVGGSSALLALVAAVDGLAHTNATAT